MKQTVEVHILAWNEREIMPFVLRHWQTFAWRVIVHDAGSTDGTREIVEDFGAELVDWRTDGVNDQLAMELKNACWQGTKADWVATMDCDELLYFPLDAFDTLAVYRMMGVAVVKPHGWEMFSDKFPTGTGQIYDEVKMGARDQKWYAKPVLFTPHLVANAGLGHGAHDSYPVLHDGRCLGQTFLWPPAEPPTYLLHCKHVGGMERSTERYKRQRMRLSQTNVEHRWGNFAPELDHAKEKREYILAHLEQVIP